MLINPPVGNQGSENSCVAWAVGYTALGILSYPKYGFGKSIYDFDPFKIQGINRLPTTWYWRSGGQTIKHTITESLNYYYTTAEM